MNLGDAASVTTRTYVTKLRALLPFYFLLLGIPAIGATIGTLALPIVGYLLSRAGVLGELYDILQQDAPIKLDSQSSGNELVEQQSPAPLDTDAFRQVLTDVPVAVRAIFVLCFVTAVVLVLLTFAVVAAGRLHSTYAALADRSPVKRGTAGLFSSSRTLVGLYLLETLLHVIIPSILGFSLSLLGARPIFIPPLLILFAIPGAPLLHAFCAFSRNAAVVDEAGLVRALKGTASFARQNLWLVAGYALVAVVSAIGLFVLLLIVSASQAPQIFTPLLVLAFFPFFDTLRTLLYAQAQPNTTVVNERSAGVDSGWTTQSSDSLPFEDDSEHETDRGRVGRSAPPGGDSSPESVDDEPTETTPSDLASHGSSNPQHDPGLSGEVQNTASSSNKAEITVPRRPTTGRLARLRGAIATGWNELVSFTASNVGLLSLSFGLFAAAVGLGWFLTASIDGLFEASIERRIADIFPPSTMLNFFANNWTVGIRQATAGLAFGVPTVVSLVQNGILIGALFRFEVAPMLLVAFLIPHGLVELPALWLSGALGFHLGRVGVGVVTGRTDQDSLAAELDTATDVLIGLGILFAVAAVIEAFVSPYYWQLFL